MLLQRPETDQFVLVFVPQAKREGSKAGPQRDNRAFLEGCVFVMAFGEIIIRDAMA